MKYTTLQIEVGTPRMEDGVVVSTMFIIDDSIRILDEYLANMFSQNYFQYIVTLDGVPLCWNLTATGSTWSIK
jgi:hypothetical protein